MNERELDLGFARLDLERAARLGHAEVVYAAGKTPEQLAEILAGLAEASDRPVLATRASPEAFAAVRRAVPQAEYHPLPRAIVVAAHKAPPPVGRIAVVSAGTADLPVAEEAALTAELLGSRVERIWDVGVAGLHRLLRRLEEIRRANVVIVVAGMEGALPSVVGGLVDAPLIAVPTSVGYGANFGGLSSLLAMLTSCAPGIVVVNIDNGFGAAVAAHRINRLAAKEAAG
ncbi:MAG TPA: nickel pincer cofactor biosynthesis protein LarB [Limnochordia bacterium]